MEENSREFKQALDIVDLQRRTKEVEDEIRTMKPIVYNTASSVRNIEKSVEKMERNSDKIKGYFLAAAISGVLGIVFIAIQNSMFGG